MSGRRGARSGGRLPMALLLAAAVVGCRSVPDRAYYVPDGEVLGRSIGSFEGENPAHQLNVICQGVYENLVGGELVRTVHIQLLLGSLTSSPVSLTARRLAVDLHGPSQDPDEPDLLGPVVTLPVAEVWSRRTRLQGDLIVEGFSRRAFDLFFDEAGPFDEALPETVLLRWQGTAVRRPMAGQCLFVRIPPDDPLAPSPVPISDPAFGLRDGYYLPGRIALGRRGLLPTEEERMHYVFHAPQQGWFW